MRVEPANPPPTPPPGSPASKPPKSAAPPTPTPDRIESAPAAPAAGPLDALGTWARSEWTTVAGTAHGLAAAPGVVSKAWLNAAHTNAALGERIGATLDAWPQLAPEARATAAAGLGEMARSVSPAAEAVATALSAHTDAAALPAAVETQARGAVAAFASAASAQTAKAAGIIPGFSRTLGATAGDVHAGLTGMAAAESALSRIPVLRDIPVVGLALTGAGIAGDVAGGKSIADASIANVGGTVAGTLVGGAVTAQLATLAGGGAIADAAAETLGVAVAAGPAGWAIAGGVLAGAAVTYGVYKAVESAPGQHVIDGLMHAAARLTAVPE